MLSLNGGLDLALHRYDKNEPLTPVSACGYPQRASREGDVSQSRAPEETCGEERVARRLGAVVGPRCDARCGTGAAAGR